MFIERSNKVSVAVAVVVCLLVLFMGNSPLFGQFTTATLGGVVTDSSGHVVQGATVTAQDIATGLSRTVTTGGDGSYLIPSLPVGTYQLTVAQAGFSTYVQTGIVLEVTQSVTQSVTLHPGAVQQRVVVSAAAQMLPTQTSTVSQVIASRSITQLPLNGREAQQLVFLVPGAVDLSSHYCGTNCQGGVYPGAQFAQVNGGGPGNVTYELDGGDHNDNYTNENFPFPIPDAVQEFGVQAANMSAEFGNSAVVVNIVTKSGTNQFHGNLFEFLRNGDLNGRNYFAPVQDTLKRNQFGGTIGGPILKNKLFFFFSYQGTHTTSAPSEEIAFVPTADERMGNFAGSGITVTDPLTGLPFPLDQIPAGRLSPAAQFMLQTIPLPNGPNNQVTFTGPTSKTTDNQFMPKIDYISGHNRLSGVYFNTKFNEPPDLAAGKADLLAMDGNGSLVRVQTVAINDAYVVNHSLLLNAWFSDDHSAGQSLTGAPFNFPDAGIKVASSGPPTIQELYVGGFFSAEGSHNGSFDRNDWKTRVVATLQKGPHELSFGGDIYHLGTPLANGYLQNPNIAFQSQVSGSNLSDYLLGTGVSFTQGGGDYYDYTGLEGDLFVQDNWRMTNALTVNLGVRWNPYFPYKDSENRIPCYDPGQQSQRYPNAPVGLIYAGDPGCPDAGTLKSANVFAPRVGFAYQLDPSTVLRGGSGLYNTNPSTDQINNFTNTAPFSPLVVLNGTGLDDPYGTAGVVDPFPAAYANNGVPPSSVTFVLPVGIGGVFPPKFKLSTFAIWNLMLERQLGQDWLFSLGYFGNAGYNLSSNAVGREELNQAIYIPGESTEANTQERRINPNFSSIQKLVTDFNSRYESLQVNVKKRFTRGLSVLANYTWSKKEDNYGPDYTVTNQFDRHLDWGVSGDNVTNVFTLSAVWNIPRLPVRSALASSLINGWEATGITSLRSGFPFTVFSGVDNSFSGIGADRADFTGTDIGQAALHGQSKAQMLQQYFNTSLFVPNAVGTFGNSPKSGLYGPGFVNQDFAAIKYFKLVKSANMQFRAEFFNLFNHANFGNPGTTLGSGFGQITSAGDPRIVQFALKLAF